MEGRVAELVATIGRREQLEREDQLSGRATLSGLYQARDEKIIPMWQQQLYALAFLARWQAVAGTQRSDQKACVVRSFIDCLIGAS
jgi:hypothetical protein